MKHTDQTSASSPDTLLIFERPDLYFFPALAHTVYPTFCIPNRSLRYLIYKLLYVLRLPGTHLFWGGWKKHLAHAKRVVIFDYGYQRGMERYIRRVNPDCKVSLFFWNVVTPQRINHKLFSDKSAIYSTDPADCDIRVVSDSGDAAYLHSLGALYTPRGLTYREYLDTVAECDILLDIVQQGQQALTMRVMEAIFLSKKLITNNPGIRDYDFYNENNILLLPKLPSLPTAERIAAFLETPFVPYRREVLDYFDFDAWKERFPG